MAVGKLCNVNTWFDEIYEKKLMQKQSFQRRFIAAFTGAGLALVGSVLQAQETQGDDPASKGPIAVLGAKLGYNSARGAVAGVSVAANQLFGRPQRLILSAEASRDDNRLNLSYGLPQVSDERPSIGFSAYRNETRASAAFGFKTLSYGITPKWTKKLNDASAVSVALDVSSDSIYGLSTPTSALIAADSGTRQKTALVLDYGLQGGGNSLSLTGSFAATSTGGRSIKAEGNVARQWTHEDSPIILVTKLSFGSLVSQSGASHIGDRFFMGQSLVRGFEYGGIGPRDLAAGNAALGGNTYASVKVDLAFPTLTKNQENVLLGAFFDAGSLWGLDSTNGGVGGASAVDAERYVRSSVGLSLRYQLGVGSANLYVSQPLSKQSYDSDNRVQLSFEAKF